MEWWQTMFDEDFLRWALDPIPPERTREEVDFIIDVMGLDASSDVLDLACGTGRDSLELARRGMRNVVGLDYTQAYLDRAERQAATEGLEVRFVQGDMKDLPFDTEFDAVMSIFTSFGYFADRADDERVIAGVSRALRPGGRFLLDVMNRDYVVRHFAPRGWSEHDDEFLMEERAFDLGTSVSHSTYTFMTTSGPVRREARVRLYSLHELSGLFGQHGMRLEGAWGTLDKQPLTWDHNRMRALGVKN